MRGHYILSVTIFIDIIEENMKDTKRFKKEMRFCQEGFGYGKSRRSDLLLQIAG